MSLISELKKWEHDPTKDLECLCCGKTPQHGGFYSGIPDILICSECIVNSDLRAFGIVLGDAVLDKYARGNPADEVHTNILVRSIVQRLEGAIYWAIAEVFTYAT